MPLSNYCCHACGGELLIDEEYHQKKMDGPTERIPMRELSVYCEHTEECGEAGQLDEIAVTKKYWAHHRPAAVIVWWHCTGEAHQPGNMSDHCGVCMPWWAEVPECPDCHGRLTVKDKFGPHGFETDYYRCPKCRIKFYAGGLSNAKSK